MFDKTIVELLREFVKYPAGKRIVILTAGIIVVFGYVIVFLFKDNQRLYTDRLGDEKDCSKKIQAIQNQFQDTIRAINSRHEQQITGIYIEANRKYELKLEKYEKVFDATLETNARVIRAGRRASIQVKTAKQALSKVSSDATP